MMTCGVVIPPIFNGSRSTAFFTTKASGSLEFGVQNSELKDSVIYLPIQKHTDKVLVLDYDLEPKVADAVITDRKGILIGVQTADCAPVLLYDIKRRIAGAVHAGWRGTAAGILRNTIQAMTDRFYSSPADILIAIGTGIRWCCYNVGYEVIEAVSRATGEGEYFIKRGEKYCLDLPTANKYQALSSGVPADNIWMSGECTSCLPEKYYSYRHAKGATGRQCGFIGII